MVCICGIMAYPVVIIPDKPKIVSSIPISDIARLRGSTTYSFAPTWRSSVVPILPYPAEVEWCGQDWIGPLDDESRMKRFDHKSVKFHSYFTWENFVKEKRDYYSQGRHQPQYCVIIRGISQIFASLSGGSVHRQKLPHFKKSSK